MVKHKAKKSFARSVAENLYDIGQNLTGEAMTAASEFVKDRGTRYIRGARSQKSKVKKYARPVPLNRSVYQGRGGKRFPRPKRKRKAPLFNASLSRTEIGGEKTGADCVYVGHGPPIYEICICVFESMIRKVLGNHGIRLSSSERPIFPDLPAATTGAYLYFHVQFDEAGDFVRIQADVDNAMTIHLLAGVLFEELTDAMTSARTQVCIKNGNLSLVTGTTQVANLANVDFEKASVNLMVNSQMTIQNRTPGDGASDLSSTDITHNPLDGKVYEISGNMLNGGVGTFRYPTILANINNGSMDYNYVSGALVNPSFKRPPTVSSIKNCQRSAKVSLAPGQIRKSLVKFSRRMSLDKFFQTMFEFIQESGSIAYKFVRTPLGRCKVYGFEKRCRTGTGTGNDITVGYEVNTTIKTSISTKTAAIQMRHA